MHAELVRWLAFDDFKLYIVDVSHGPHYVYCACICVGVQLYITCVCFVRRTCVLHALSVVLSVQHV